MKDNFNLRKFLTENKLTSNSKVLKEELTFSFDEYSYEIDDNAYQAEVEAGIKAKLPNISDEVLQAIIDSSVEYYYDQREENVPSSDIVDMAVDYYNDEMAGDDKPSAPRQKYDLSSVDLSGLDKGQREAFDKFIDVYLKPYGDTDTQEDLEIFVKQFGKVENAYDLDSLIPNSFQYDNDERESMQTQLRRAYLDDDQPINENKNKNNMNNFDLRKFLTENRATKVLNEVKFTKKEIVNSVTFPTGEVYTVGERTNYDGMRITSITPIPENEREQDEVVAIEMRDGEDAVIYKFTADGKEVEY